MGRVVWSVREGRVGELDAREIMSGYRTDGAAREPGFDDLIFLPDGSGPWRVVDWALGDGLDSPENILVVELFGD
jgi:hypothetical protein